MLKIHRRQDGARVEITLEGEVAGDRGTPLPIREGLGSFEGVREARVNARGVSRINSFGSRTWIEAFGAMRDAGVRIVFEEASVQFVDQLLLLRTFACGGAVESVFLPYRCPACDRELSLLVKTKDIPVHAKDLPQVECPSCGSKDTHFDNAEVTLKQLLEFVKAEN